MKYHGETRKNAGRHCTHDINNYAHQVLRNEISGPVYSVRHTNVIVPTDHTLYHYDFLHLSDKGNVFFRKNLSDALIYFNNHQEMFRYPPVDH